MFPQVQEFSAGYYIMAPLYVEPHEVSTPRINDRVYQFLQSEVFGTFDRIILKCKSRVFEAEPSRSISPETLALPREYITEKLGIRFPPEKVVAYVAKEDIAEKLLNLEKGQELVQFETWDE